MSDIAGVTTDAEAGAGLVPADRSATDDERLDFDLLVIGGGSAGFAAAIAATELGKRVGVANTGPLGGTCTNVGCIPSKALIRAAERYSHAGQHPFEGVNTAQGELDWTAVQAQKDRLIGDLRQVRYTDVLAAYPTITLLEGRAAFQPDGAVQVGDRAYRAHRYLIATGAQPRIPPIPGVAETEPLDSTTLLDLPKLPESLVVLGGRAVALELGQMLARFGVKVTILQRSSRLVPNTNQRSATPSSSTSARTASPSSPARTWSASAARAAPVWSTPASWANSASTTPTRSCWP